MLLGERYSSIIRHNGFKVRYVGSRYAENGGGWYHMKPDTEPDIRVRDPVAHELDFLHPNIVKRLRFRFDDEPKANDNVTADDVGEDVQMLPLFGDGAIGTRFNTSSADIYDGPSDDSLMAEENEESTEPVKMVMIA